MVKKRQTKHLKGIPNMISLAEDAHAVLDLVEIFADEIREIDPEHKLLIYVEMVLGNHCWEASLIKSFKHEHGTIINYLMALEQELGWLRVHKPKVIKPPLFPAVGTAVVITPYNMPADTFLEGVFKGCIPAKHGLVPWLVAQNGNSYFHGECWWRAVDNGGGKALGEDVNTNERLLIDHVDAFHFIPKE